MHGSTEFLQNLALVLCVAAASTVVFQRLRQPVIFGYLLAGLIIGPHVPIPLAVDQSTVDTLSELGVILLMFGLGLEFSLRKLMQVGSTAGIIAVIQSSAMVWLGYLLGRAFGWTSLESVYAGAVVAISSTTIIVKAFEEQGATGRYTELVFGVLIIEDLIAIFLLAILTTVSAGGGVSFTALGATAARLAAFLAGLIGVGLLLIPRLVRAVVKLDRPETTLVASIGICFAAALLALAFGYSVALGAFIAGSLVAESGEEKTVEHVVAPVRDLFAAVFFVAVGMMIDPAMIVAHWGAILVLTVAVIVGKVVFVSIGAFLSGYGTRTSVQSGMSLAQIGEFSFIIAGVGLASGATRGFLYPIAVAVSAITTLSTPWLIRASGPFAAYVDRKLPKRLQTLAALYGSWLERVRSSPSAPDERSDVRRHVRVLLIDTVLIGAIIIGTAVEIEPLTEILTHSFAFSVSGARAATFAFAAVVALPLLLGMMRSARLLGAALAARALPAAADGTLDLGAAPRRVLVVMLQLVIVCIVGVPLVAITQPFLPLYEGTLLFAIVVVVLGFVFWQRVTNLHGHARAGAEVIVAALAQQLGKDDEPADAEPEALTLVHGMLPGMGDPVRVRIAADSPAVDRTLSQLNLRGLTGATVLAITRGAERVVLPIGAEVLHAGDVLALAGTQEAVALATHLLRRSTV